MTDSNPHAPEKRVIRFKAVATELGISTETLRQMCKKGTGPRVLRLSEKCLGVRRGDLEAWLREREKKF